jgi:hypothetical protein
MAVIWGVVDGCLSIHSFERIILGSSLKSHGKGFCIYILREHILKHSNKYGTIAKFVNLHGS